MFATAAIRTKDLGQHRLPGVCVSILGFGLIFTGIMMMGVDGIAKKNEEKAIEIAGPILLALGGAAIIAGFTTQYILHKRHKKLLLRLKKAREKVKKSVEAIANTPSGTAAKYLSDAHDEPALASTSRTIIPSITVDTMLDPDEAYARKLNLQYIYQDAVDNQFLDFSPQSNAFDDSSEDECAVSGPTQTEAIIEYRRRQSQDSTFSGDGTRSGTKLCHTRAPSTPTIREHDGERTKPVKERIVIKTETEIVHITSPRLSCVDQDSDSNTISITNGSYNSHESMIMETNHDPSLDSDQLPPATARSISAVSLSSSVSKSSTQNSGSDMDEIRSGILQMDRRKSSNKCNRRVKFQGQDSNRLPDIAQHHLNIVNKRDPAEEETTVPDNKHYKRKHGTSLDVRNDHSSSNKNSPDSLRSIEHANVYNKRSSITGMRTTSWIDADNGDTFSLSSSFSDPRDLPLVETPGQYGGNSSSSLSSSVSGSRENIYDKSSELEDAQSNNNEQTTQLDINHTGGDVKIITESKMYGRLNSDSSPIFIAKEHTPTRISQKSKHSYLDQRLRNEETKPEILHNIANDVVSHKESKLNTAETNHVSYWTQSNCVEMERPPSENNHSPIKQNGDILANEKTRNKKTKGKMTKRGRCKNPPTGESGLNNNLCDVEPCMLSSRALEDIESTA